MHKNSKVGIVCCSNGQSVSNKEIIELLEKALLEMGLIQFLVNLFMQRIQCLVELRKNEQRQ